MTVMRMRLYSNTFSDVGDNDDGDDVGWWWCQWAVGSTRQCSQLSWSKSKTIWTFSKLLLLLIRCEFLAIFFELWTCLNYFSSSLVYLFCNLQSTSTVTAIDVKILKYFKNIWKFLSKISVWICWNSSRACLCLPLLQFCSLCLDTHRRPQILHNHYKLNTIITKRMLYM